MLTWREPYQSDVRSALRRASVTSPVTAESRWEVHTFPGRREKAAVPPRPPRRPRWVHFVLSVRYASGFASGLLSSALISDLLSPIPISVAACTFPNPSPLGGYPVMRQFTRLFVSSLAALTLVAATVNAHAQDAYYPPPANPPPAPPPPPPHTPPLLPTRRSRTGSTSRLSPSPRSRSTCRRAWRCPAPRASRTGMTRSRCPPATTCRRRSGKGLSSAARSCSGRSI